MKVYSAPIPAPAWPSPYNREDYDRNNEAYTVAIKADLIAKGFDGPHTGKIVSFGVADGSAQYMFADGGRRSGLVHLEIGDAYHYRDVSFLPKAEILRRMAQETSLKSMFARQ